VTSKLAVRLTTVVQLPVSNAAPRGGPEMSARRASRTPSQYDVASAAIELSSEAKVGSSEARASSRVASAALTPASQPRTRGCSVAARTRRCVKVERLRKDDERGGER